ncbi:MAG: carbamate kinase, partial [Bacteroidetes bacterium HGW-Bacteroidetes-22]
EGLERDILTIITEVVVDKNDPAFSNLTKPVGPFYTKEDADRIAGVNGSKFAEDPRGRGWRKVVASPKPISINNVKSIEKLARDGQIIITVGGGGIPVFYVEEKKLQGIDAVIDKDLASSQVASQIHADEFIILTDVPKVYINFRKPNEKALDRISLSEARRLMTEGHFSAGSMAPKVAACIQFVENGGKEAMITTATELGKQGAGTVIFAG